MDARSEVAIDLSCTITRDVDGEGYEATVHVAIPCGTAVTHGLAAPGDDGVVAVDDFIFEWGVGDTPLAALYDALGEVGDWGIDRRIMEAMGGAESSAE